ncbi:Carbohydrate sulfotransferase 15 [Mactra antiquata]
MSEFNFQQNIQIKRVILVSSVVIFLMMGTYLNNTETQFETYEYPAISESIRERPIRSTTVARNNSYYDIMNMPQIEFNNLYKNPCWVGTDENGPLDDEKFHCLPYFYILGVKKSGTTDLFTRISKHPQFARPDMKESQWLTRIRFGVNAQYKSVQAILQRTKLDVRSVGFYVSMFDTAASSIMRTVTNIDDRAPYFRMITGDATPANLHMHTKWSKLPGNEGLTEPKYTNFHYIKHLTPEAKIIIIFREPVSRMLSDYLYLNRLRPTLIPEKFHRDSVRLTKAYEKCFLTYSQRRCIYNETLKETLRKTGTGMTPSFTAGFYAFYLKEIYEVFDKSNVLPILMTDYTENMKNVLSKVFDFLELDQPSTEQWKPILVKSIENESKFKRVKMLSKTKRLLEHFYRPHNEEMAKLLNDSRYLF